MIVVSGASGQLGRQIIDNLADHVPASDIGASVRDPGQVPDLAERGVRVRRGDFADAATLAYAFEDADQVLLVSVNAIGDAGLRMNAAAIDAAVSAGAGRIVYTSHMGASPTSLFAACRQHAATEELLRASGVPFTSLRNGYYASSAAMFAGFSLGAGTVALPADGPTCWTAHADLAAAAAAVLADPGRFEGPTPPLTAERLYDFADVARVATEILGRPIERVDVPDGQFRDRIVAGGMPEERADFLLGIFAAARAGEFATVDPTLTELIGREPVTLRTVLDEQLPRG